MDSKPKLKDAVVISQRDDLYLVFYPERPDWVVLYENGGVLLELLDGTRTAEELMKEVGTRLDIPEDGARITVEKTIEVLEQHKMLEGEDLPEPCTSFHLDMVWIHLTHECNLRCRYCYVSAGEALENELSTEEVIRLLDDVKALGEGRYQTVALSGGEPLLREDIWDIAAHVRKLGMTIILATNGTLVDDAMAKKLKEYVSYVHLSLDGTEEHHDELRGKGSFQKAMTAMRHLQANGVPCYFSAVVTKHNMRDVPNLVRIAHEYGIREVKSPPIMPIGRGDEELQPSNVELAELWRDTHLLEEKLGYKVHNVNDRSVAPAHPIKYGRYSCTAGINSISIDSDGSVYPCQAAMFGEFYVGNVRERSLKDIWEDPGSFKRWRDTTVQAIPKCSACQWRMYCGGGCRMHAYTKHGKICAPDTFCDLYFKLYEEGLWNHVYRDLKREIIPEKNWETVIAYLKEKEGIADERSEGS